MTVGRSAKPCLKQKQSNGYRDGSLKNGRPLYS